MHEPLLREQDRERLWRALELPVFEQLITPDGRMLAAECDAHAGLHLNTEAAVFEEADERVAVTPSGADAAFETAWLGSIEFALCPCGKPGPRLVPAAACACRALPLAIPRNGPAIAQSASAPA